MIPSILATASHTDWAIITDLVVILVSAAVVAVVMQPMRLAAIPVSSGDSCFIGTVTRLDRTSLMIIPDEQAVLRACAVARRRAPETHLVARTRVVSERAGLMEMGANSVTVDETAAAAPMLQAVMACLDMNIKE